MKRERSDKLHLPDGTCLQCGQPFRRITRRDLERKRFCSRRCGIKFNHRQNLLHPQGYTGTNGPHWKGGRQVTPQGYVRVWVGHKTYRLEHRLVMEQKLGRALLATEHVHHINGVRGDNRPENLELWGRHHPTGVRASQKKHCPTCTCFDEPRPS